MCTNEWLIQIVLILGIYFINPRANLHFHFFDQYFYCLSYSHLIKCILLLLYLYYLEKLGNVLFILNNTFVYSICNLLWIFGSYCHARFISKPPLKHLLTTTITHKVYVKITSSLCVVLKRVETTQWTSFQYSEIVNIL